MSDDTDERPIAEVIGAWTRATCPPGCCTRWTGNGKTLYGGSPPEPTVDDMLDWLYERGYAVEVGSARNEGERDIWCYAHPFGDTKATAELSADGETAHAAVEAAVRQAASVTALTLCRMSRDPHERLNL